MFVLALAGGCGAAVNSEVTSEEVAEDVPQADDAGMQVLPEEDVPQVPEDQGSARPDAGGALDVAVARDVRVAMDVAVARDVRTTVDVAVTRDTGTVRDVSTGGVTNYPGVPGVSPTLGGCPLFPPDNPWNRDISAAPLASNSSRIIANILDHGGQELHADFGTSNQYGIPFNIVPSGQAMVPIQLLAHRNESDPGPYPIPANPLIEAGRDRHILVLQSGSCRLYELYHSSRTSSGYSGDSGAIFDLRSNALRPHGWTSADQAGLPILPGLLRYDEVASGQIRHAIRATFEHTRNRWVAPGTHPGGHDDADAPPMAARMRLRANYDISRLPPQARVIAAALKRYGLFVADTGYNFWLSGVSDPRWNMDDLRELDSIPGSAFEVIDSGPLRQW